MIFRESEGGCELYLCGLG